MKRTIIITMTLAAAFFLKAKTQKQQQNGIKNILDLTRILMVQHLNGTKVQTAQQKHRHSGQLLNKHPTTLIKSI